ncbi:MAG: hypothetical protein WCK89_12370 [bacterium]
MPTRQTNNTNLLILLALIPVCGLAAAAPAPHAAPANAPAEVIWKPSSGSLKLRYSDETILEAKILVCTPQGERAARRDEVVLAQSATGSNKVEQVLRLALAQTNAGTGLVLRGTVTGSDEAFAAETKSDAQKRFPLVRTSVGVSRNLRNNGIYDRHLDWVLTGPADGQTRIVPGKQKSGRMTFEIQCSGKELALAFCPRYYQQHKGIKHFTPWTKKMRQDSITGWCSWWAYGGGFNQKNAQSLLDVWREQHMADYGYRFIQIDDCFEIAQGAPEKWLNWNNKFPGGMQGYADSVRAAGFTPGVWITSVYKDAPVFPEQDGWFVRGTNGAPYRTPDWKDYCIDATIPAAADTLIRPIYRGVRAAGYGYVKIDGLRHRLYDSIDHCLPDMAARGITRDDCFRSYLKAARAELGEETFVLACWGVIPEVTGLADACRLGGDGFGPGSLQCYNSWNGVIWRNDPDHCDILPARKAVDSGDVLKTEAVSGLLEDTVIRPTVVSMAGAMLMLSDKAEVYRNSKALEGARRASPVLFSFPGQLYDYGGGTVCPWWLMEIDRPFEHWAVLSHLNFGEQPLPAATVRFRDLGLGDDQLVWEFWTRKLVAVSNGGFEVEALGPRGTRTYAIRPRLDRPQLLSTSRHISQGGAELDEVTWKEKTRTLSGHSRVVIDDPYELAIHVPAPFVCRGATMAGDAAQVRTEGAVLRIAYTPAATTNIVWAVQF